MLAHRHGKTHHQLYYDDKEQTQTSSSCLGSGDLSASWAIMWTGAELERPRFSVVVVSSAQVCPEVRWGSQQLAQPSRLAVI